MAGHSGAAIPAVVVSSNCNGERIKSAGANDVAARSFWLFAIRGCPRHYADAGIGPDAVVSAHALLASAVFIVCAFCRRADRSAHIANPYRSMAFVIRPSGLGYVHSSASDFFRNRAHGMAGPEFPERMAAGICVGQAEYAGGCHVCARSVLYAATRRGFP